MSITLSLLLVLVLVSQHACECDARSLGVVNVGNHTTSKERSNKENEGAARVSEREAAMAEEEMDNTRRAAGSEEIRSVGWKVPEKGAGLQPEAGFNLDYLPPKTHPPVHN